MRSNPSSSGETGLGASGSVTGASLTEASSIRPMSGGNALAVTMSLVAGVAGTVQIAVMGRLGDRVGVIPAFAFAAAVAAGGGLVALLVARRSLVGFGGAGRQPGWLWIGGGVGGAVGVLGTVCG